MNGRTIRLTDIEVRTLTPFKVSLAHYGAQDHSRWVFRGPLPGSSDTFFYKIWNPAYVRRDNILAAIESGFYDERMVPALYAVVFHNGVCRGYVMHEGKTRQDALNDEFRDFVLLRTRQTGFFAVQFARCHTMVYKNKWSLLDLDGVYPIEAFPRLSQDHCRFEDSAYEKFVAGLYEQWSSDTSSTIGAAAHNLPLAASRAITASTPRAAVQKLKLYTRLVRRVTRKFRNIMPQIRLIEY